MTDTDADGVYQTDDGLWHARCAHCDWQTIEVVTTYQTRAVPDWLYGRHCATRSHIAVTRSPTRVMGPFQRKVRWGR